MLSEKINKMEEQRANAIVPITKGELKGKLVFKGKGSEGQSILANIQVPVRGLSVFALEQATGIVREIEVDKDGQKTKAKNVGTVLVSEGYYYVQALNMKNAIKKFTP